MFQQIKTVVVVIFTWIGLIIFPKHIIAQTNNSLSVEEIFPSARTLEGLERKVQRAKHTLSLQSLKQLNKIKKKEKRFYNKLYKQDSLKTKELFGDVDSAYRTQSELASALAAGSNLKDQFYNGGLDSIQSALQFFSLKEKMDGITPNSELMKTVAAYEQLKQYYTQGVIMENWIKDRQTQILGSLKNSGLVKDLLKYQKQVLYYNQQLRQTRELLSQSDKLAGKVLSLATQIPQFQKFFSKFSMFASIFPQSEPGVASLVSGGLQTRAALQPQMASSLGIVDPQQSLQQGIGQAQQGLQQLRRQATAQSWGQAGDMPQIKTNEEKTKSFWKRIELGSNLQTTKANYGFPATTDVALSLGIKLDKKSIVGIGAGYKLGLGKDWHHIKLTHEGVSLRSFFDWKFKGVIWLTGGLEANHRQRLESVQVLKYINSWQRSAVVGMSAKFHLGKFRTDTRILYDILWKEQIPRGQPVLLRVGYLFN